MENSTEKILKLFNLHKATIRKLGRDKNMKKSLTFGVMVILLLTSVLMSIKQAKSSEPPATEWSRTYGGPEPDWGYSMVQMNDGGYAIAGMTESFGAGGQDFWLVRTDTAGNLLWNKTYGGIGDDWGYSVVQTTDGGYALAGSTWSFGEGATDCWLVKTDASGDMQWSKTYGGGNKDYGHFVVQTGDGGYAIAGNTGSFGAGAYDFWLVKTDSAGNMQWNETYGGEDYEESFSMIQTDDGGYALVGYTRSFGAGNEDFWLVKTDSAGNMQWNETYGGGNKDYAYSLTQTGDGGYTIAGHTRSFGAGDYDFWLVKTDGSGNMTWSQTYGGIDSDSVHSLIQTSDGGYAITGQTQSLGAGSSDLWLVKTDSAGNMQWNETYGGEDLDSGYSVVQTGDGGYAIAGCTVSYGAGDRDFWLIKLASEEIHLHLTPDTGFSCTTVAGSGFVANSEITISWDDTTIHTVPSPIIADSYGNFTAIISVLTQNDPGPHTVKATDELGNWTSATFTVIDMTGPQGSQGHKGDEGDMGPQGPQGLPGETRELPLIVDAFTIAASIIAICLATVALLKKKS